MNKTLLQIATFLLIPSLLLADPAMAVGFAGGPASRPVASSFAARLDGQALAPSALSSMLERKFVRLAPFGFAMLFNAPVAMASTSPEVDKFFALAVGFIATFLAVSPFFLLLESVRKPAKTWTIKTVRALLPRSVAARTLGIIALILIAAPSAMAGAHDAAGQANALAHLALTGVKGIAGVAVLGLFMKKIFYSRHADLDPIEKQARMRAMRSQQPLITPLTPGAKTASSVAGAEDEYGASAKLLTTPEESVSITPQPSAPADAPRTNRTQHNSLPDDRWSSARVLEGPPASKSAAPNMSAPTKVIKEEPRDGLHELAKSNDNFKNVLEHFRVRPELSKMFNLLSGQGKENERAKKPIADVVQFAVKEARIDYDPKDMERARFAARTIAAYAMGYVDRKVYFVDPGTVLVDEPREPIQAINLATGKLMDLRSYLISLNGSLPRTEKIILLQKFGATNTGIPDDVVPKTQTPEENHIDVPLASIVLNSRDERKKQTTIWEDDQPHVSRAKATALRSSSQRMDRPVIEPASEVVEPIPAPLSPLEVASEALADPGPTTSNAIVKSVHALASVIDPVYASRLNFAQNGRVRVDPRPVKALLPEQTSTNGNTALPLLAPKDRVNPANNLRDMLPVANNTPLLVRSIPQTLESVHREAKALLPAPPTSLAKAARRVVDDSPILAGDQREMISQLQKALATLAPEELRDLLKDPESLVTFLAQRFDPKEVGYRRIDKLVLLIRHTVQEAKPGEGYAKIVAQKTGLTLARVRAHWEEAFTKEGKGKKRDYVFKIQTYAAHRTAFRNMVAQFIQTPSAQEEISKALPKAQELKRLETESQEPEPVLEAPSAPTVQPMPSPVVISDAKPNSTNWVMWVGAVAAVVIIGILAIVLSNQHHLVNAAVGAVFHAASPIATPQAPAIQVVQEAAQAALRHTIQITPHTTGGLGQVVLQLRHEDPILRNLLGGHQNIWHALAPGKPNPVELLREALNIKDVRHILPGEYDISGLYQVAANMTAPAHHTAASTIPVAAPATTAIPQSHGLASILSFLGFGALMTIMGQGPGAGQEAPKKDEATLRAREFQIIVSGISSPKDNEAITFQIKLLAPRRFPRLASSVFKLTRPSHATARIVASEIADTIDHIPPDVTKLRDVRRKILEAEKSVAASSTASYPPDVQMAAQGYDYNWGGPGYPGYEGHGTIDDKAKSKSFGESVEGKLVVTVGSRALFDLEKEDQIAHEHGIDYYRQYQREHERDTLKPGIAFSLIRKLLRFNSSLELLHKLVEVILVSSNDADSGIRIFRSIQEHGLDITRGAFLNGEPKYPYLPGFKSDLYLSAHMPDVLEAIQHGNAAAHLMPRTLDVEPTLNNVLLIGFDYDGVVGDDAPEAYLREHGLPAFKTNEAHLANLLHGSGPMARFLQALIDLRQKAELAESAMKLKIALFTARNNPAHERAIRTIRNLSQGRLVFDMSFLLGGLDKAPFIEAAKPDIFFDDQVGHLTSIARSVVTALVPYGIANRPPDAQNAANYDINWGGPGYPTYDYNDIPGHLEVGLTNSETGPAERATLEQLQAARNLTIQVYNELIEVDKLLREVSGRLLGRWLPVLGDIPLIAARVLKEGGISQLKKDEEYLRNVEKSDQLAEMLKSIVNDLIATPGPAKSAGVRRQKATLTLLQGFLPVISGVSSKRLDDNDKQFIQSHLEETVTRLNKIPVEKRDAALRTVYPDNHMPPSEQAIVADLDQRISHLQPTPPSLPSPSPATHPPKVKKLAMPLNIRFLARLKEAGIAVGIETTTGETYVGTIPKEENTGLQLDDRTVPLYLTLTIGEARKQFLPGEIYKIGPVSPPYVYTELELQFVKSPLGRAIAAATGLPLHVIAQTLGSGLKAYKDNPNQIELSTLVHAMKLRLRPFLYFYDPDVKNSEVISAPIRFHDEMRALDLLFIGSDHKMFSLLFERQPYGDIWRLDSIRKQLHPREKISFVPDMQPSERWNWGSVVVLDGTILDLRLAPSGEFRTILKKRYEEEQYLQGLRREDALGSPTIQESPHDLTVAPVTVPPPLSRETPQPVDPGRKFKVEKLERYVLLTLLMPIFNKKDRTAFAGEIVDHMSGIQFSLGNILGALRKIPYPREIKVAVYQDLNQTSRQINVLFKGTTRDQDRLIVFKRASYHFNEKWYAVDWRSPRDPRPDEMTRVPVTMDELVDNILKDDAIDLLPEAPVPGVPSDYQATLGAALSFAVSALFVSMYTPIQSFLSPVLIDLLLVAAGFASFVYGLYHNRIWDRFTFERSSARSA